MDLLLQGPATALVGRLARFDGTTFHPVASGSVVAPFVHVFAHGWSPGIRTQERLLAALDGVQAVPFWDPRLVDDDGRPLVADYLPLLESLHRLGPDHAVLWYSWIDDSATDADVLLAHRSRQATQINGRRLALALQQALRPDRRHRLHLVGHSHGSAVVVHAAASLRRVPEHLTLLDAPENQLTRLGGAADLIDIVLPRLRPGRGPGRLFVDSYASMFGGPYHRRPGLADVVDVSVTPPFPTFRDPVKAVTAAHMYAIDWYARSVQQLQLGVGYGWSPLHVTGRDPLPDRVPRRRPAVPGRDTGTEQLHSWYTAVAPGRGIDVRRRRELPLASSAGRLARRSQMRRRTLEGARLTLSPTAPPAVLSFTTERGDQLLEFDLVVHGGTGNEEVALALDGVTSFRSLARHPVPKAGRYLMLADGRPGRHLLTATLREPPAGTADGRRGRPGRRPVTASVRNLRLVNAPGGAVAFTPTRPLGAAFAAGAAAGSVTTVMTVLTTGWAARLLLAALNRRRRRR